MTKHLEMNRRQFVVTTAVVGGGMALGLDLPVVVGRAIAAAGDTEFSALLVIGVDDTITVRVASGNVGTGVHTSASMLLCEELHCDFTTVRSEWLSPTRNVMDGGIYTAMYGNAKNTHAQREKFLQAGASARERLKAAAAQQWNVPVAEIETKNSKLIHAKSGRSLRYGEVAAKAAMIKLTSEPKIKPMDQWTVLGKAQPSVETRGMVNGSATFGIDVQVPGMLHAAIRHSPAMGGRVKSFDTNAIKDRPGVVGVFVIGGAGTEKANDQTIRSAVVVVADHYWNAKTALDVLPIEWEGGPAATFTTDDFRKQFMAKFDEPGVVAKNVGDALSAMKTADKVIEAVYDVPYLDHALMEPMNATALVTPNRVDVWGSEKNPNDALIVAAKETGIAKEKIFINQEKTFVGGDFGRRKTEAAQQAIAVAKQVPGRPVKVIWSREEMFRQGIYRPMQMSKFQAGIGRDGLPVAWFNRHVSHSRALQNDPDNFKKTGLDPTDITTVATDNDYNIPNTRVEYHAVNTNLMVGSYRGPGHNQGPFLVESFIDEIAHVGGKDPVELRRVLLQGAKDKGWLSVLNEVAKKAQWGKPLPKGRAQGVSIALRAGTQVAEIAEVSVSPGGDLKVHSVDVAFDVGNVMNPDGIMNQLQGGIVFGLQDTLNGQITVRNGRVVEGNFDDYPMLRMADAPDVRIHFGGLTGGTKLTPIGEQSNMPLPAAVTNAIFRATGKRIRSLPIRNHDLSWA